MEGRKDETLERREERKVLEGLEETWREMEGKKVGWNGRIEAGKEG